MIKRWLTRGPKPELRILMVCMGNICRSPMAEGVLRGLLAREGLDGRVVVDSAGTLGAHRGSPPDPRAVERAARRGYRIDGQRARPVTEADFERHDLLLAMDHDNLDTLRSRCPAPLQERLGLLLAHADGLDTDEVPDPYYAGPQAFDHALDLIEAGCRGLLPTLRARLAPPSA